MRRIGALDPQLRSVVVDALLYGASAVLALALLSASPMARNRLWAQLAWPGYAAAAAGAVALAVAGNRGTRERLLRARYALALTAFVCAFAVPLAVEVHLRAAPHPAGRLHPFASSEVVVTETAAAALVRGHDPYSASLSSPELDGRSPSIPDHFPYLPAMAAFGVPRALSPQSPWLDARLYFALAAIAAAAAAFARWPAAPERRLRAVQALIVLPTGSLAVVGAADDLPVLSLMLLALVLHERGRRIASATAIATAGLLKLTAWPLLLALAVAARAGGSPRSRRHAWVAPALVAAGVVAAAAAGPTAFADDVLLFPSGLTALRSPASSATVGSFVTDAAGGPLRVAATVALLGLAAAAIAAATARLARLVAAGSAQTAAVAGTAAAGLLAVIVLAPVARVGYLAYPIDLAVWATLFRPARANRLAQ